jgi:putative tricarboxylic transport membrane protein
MTRLWEIAVAVLAVALGIAAWVLSAGFPRTEDGYPGPALFPRLLGACLLLAGGGILLGNLRRGLATAIAEVSGSDRQELLGFARVAVLLVALAFAPWLLGQIKLLPTLGLYVILACLLLGSRWYEALLTAVVLLLFVYVVFVRLLQVGV